MYKNYIFKNKTLCIDNYLILENRTEENDEIFSIDLDNKIKTISENINLSNYSNYKEFNDINREKYNTFQNIDVKDNSKLFLYTEIHSEQSKNVIFNFNSFVNSKVFLNGKCIDISINNREQRYCKTRLLKGKNTIVIEFFYFNNDIRFLLQIRDYETETLDFPGALSCLSETIKIDDLLLVGDTLYQPNKDNFEFMFFKNNSDLDLSYTINISHNESGYSEQYSFNLNEKSTLNLIELRKLCHENAKRIDLKCQFFKSGNPYLFKDFFIIIDNFEYEKEKIVYEANHYANLLHGEIKSKILGLVSIIKFLMNYVKNDPEDFREAYVYIKSLRNTLNKLVKGELSSECYNYASGDNEYFLESDIDDQILRLQYRLPPNYDSTRKYPLIMFPCIGFMSKFSGVKLENILDEDCICFDVTIRGFTGGSYAGEASFLHIFNWIKTKFNIDEDRVYLVGASNGGYGAYSIAQNHPHLFAGIFPLGSNPEIKLFENICNIPTYQIYSPRDGVYKEETKNLNFIHTNNYHQYNYEEMPHSDIVNSMYNKIILNQLITNKRELYPNKIYFSTHRNRHLKAYYININGIKQSSQYAKIELEIINSEYISVKTQGFDSFTLTIPPQINKKHLSIKIDNDIINISNYNDISIIFNKCLKWEIGQTYTKFNYRKGTGLLDVYLDKTNIILPTKLKKELMPFAKNFSQPSSSGWNPIVHINYPIYTDDTLPNSVFSSNLIIFDINKNNKLINYFQNKLIVDYTVKGFNYNGDYLILQALENPFDHKLTILLIATNNIELLKKCLFTRKLILPYYHNGPHDYLNRLALIYSNHEYKFID